MDCFIGTILPWSGNFAPVGWEFCRGQRLQISQYQALYSIIGTQYGGDGRITFNLPDLQGRVMIGAGNGIGLTPRTQGISGGTETNKLNTSNMPEHNHTLMGNISPDLTETNTPSNNCVLGVPTDSMKKPVNIYSDVSSGQETLTAMNTQSIGTTGGSIPFSVMQPFQTVNFIICTNGIYPQRP